MWLFPARLIRALGVPNFKMLIDVLLVYENGQITATSEVAKYHETMPAILSLSIEAGDKVEKIEAVGELPDKIMWLIEKYRPTGSHTYRFIDPFAEKTFDAECAFVMVRHFCHLIHDRVRQPGNLLSMLGYVFRLDRFRISIKIPGYSKLPLEQRRQFEKELKQGFRRVKIEG
jgi:hypothetical protein